MVDIIKVFKYPVAQAGMTDYIASMPVNKDFVYMPAGMCTHTHTHTHTYIYIYIYTQGVPGGKDLTSGECSLGQTITI